MNVTTLDNYLEPLHQGVWEVAVPKETVTEPLDTGWKKSGINVPSPGTIASYRKGRFHVHETKSEWRVHLDRHDPDKNPLLHLVDDAPLVLMISDTFMTLILDIRREEIRDTQALLTTQRYLWQRQVLSGLILGLAGLRIAKNPLLFFSNLFEVFIPLALICLAVLSLAGAFSLRLPFIFRTREHLMASGIFFAGIFAYLLPLALWAISVLVILAVWMIASACMLLKRVAKGRSSVPEGFYNRMAVGSSSLLFAVLLFICPADILSLLTVVLGLIIVLLGMTVGVNGLRLRSWMRRIG